MTTDFIWLDDSLLDPKWAEAYLQLFSQNGFTAIPCTSVATAIDKINQGLSKNLLLDVSFPGNPREGLMVLAQISPVLKKELRIVILTAYPHHQDAVTALKLTARDYLSKPIPQTGPDAGEFFHRLREAFSDSPRASRVFIVHGRNHDVRDRIDLFLTKELLLQTVVMDAGANNGFTLPEKFEQIASNCDFAVVIVTADDRLVREDNVSIRRARQNVILELGYFWGAFGRNGKLALLVEDQPNLDLPSDINGLGWIPITPDLGETKRGLRRELEAAGVI